MTPRISRRHFMTLALTAGLAAGCQQLATATPAATAAATSANTLAPVATGQHFQLENDSIAYAPHPRGCDVTTLHGSVKQADGSPLAGMVIRLWADNPDQPTDMVTQDDGTYYADIAQGIPHATYHILLLDPTKANRLSDVIIAEATGSCNLNDLTVNFVPAAQ